VYKQACQKKGGENEKVNAYFEAYVNELNYIIIHLTQFTLFMLIWPLNKLLILGLVWQTCQSPKQTWGSDGGFLKD
jgi:predicted CDP-diglyceride synthetase/phosphatidate cytidylyltransferase